jgi:hypothetical protein
MAPIKIEIAYATPTSQHLIALEIEQPSTIAQAIQQSGLLTLYPEINLAQQKVGIFSQFCTLDDYVKAGDRIEIYRPLLIDPKEARRARAKKLKK